MITPELQADLRRRYAEPHRRYHDTRHLDEVLARVDELGGDDLVRAAAWFHDAIYDPLRLDNEELSAVLAEQSLADPAEVARLVRLTASHAPEPGDVRGEILCDADLAILAAVPDRYAEYAASVREEYAAFSNDVFRQGRADVLRALLAGPIFRTERGAAWEARARHNIEAELALLAAS